MTYKNSYGIDHMEKIEIIEKLVCGLESKSEDVAEVTMVDTAYTDAIEFEMEDGEILRFERRK
tara:strand:- start:102 stop:290 length:189 start_codon:yes stop_codon:yes gene_type:complete